MPTITNLQSFASSQTKNDLIKTVLKLDFKKQGSDTSIKGSL
tara:strand:+ start:1176 stop:1301 length:126 start_codon:yes stop_codon:yes gene_type:complete